MGVHVNVFMRWRCMDVSVTMLRLKLILRKSPIEYSMRVFLTHTSEELSVLLFDTIEFLSRMV